MKRLLKWMFIFFILASQISWIGARVAFYYYPHNDLSLYEKMMICYAESGLALLISFMLLFILCGWREK
jgi:hypothetical protein